MRKAIVAFLLVLLIIGMIAIYYLINPIKNEYREINETKSIYTLNGQGSNYDYYYINRPDEEFEIYIGSFRIENYSDILYINDILVSDDSSIYSKFAIYDDVILIMFITNRFGFYDMVQYDLRSDEVVLIDNIEDMFISASSITFGDEGIDISASIVDDDKIYWNNSWIDVCDFDSTNITVEKSYTYLYDSNKKEFADDYDEFSKLMIEAYKRTYC